MDRYPPGPWRVDGWDIVVGGNPGDFDFDIVASDVFEKVNAHLISAAPDLYDALRSAYVVIDEAEWPGLREEIRKAIAKAEGKNSGA